jgi:ubiquinone/menaquinone biosynthesis C-methylase UbiE
LAVDVQQEMLDVVRSRADKAGLGERVETRRCRADELSLPAGGVDFIATVCVVHEADDRPRMLRQIRSALSPGGRYLLAEPMWHVPRAMYEQIRREASQAGLVELGERPAGFCRAVLMQPASCEKET